MSSARPLVSVLVPVYNTATYLPRCLDSLLKQTLTDFEILAVNDGSTDGSLAILQDYAAREARIRVFDQPNGGLASVRNLGLREARGKYFMTCDSDDWVEPQWIETLVRAVSRKGILLAACDCVVEEEPGHGRSKEDLRYNYLARGGRMAFDQAAWRINCLLWNKIFDLDYIRHEEISFPSGREHDDMAFMVQYLSGPGTLLALKGKRLYHYVLRGNSMMGNLFNRKNTGHEFDQLYALHFVYDWLARRGLWEQRGCVFLAHLHHAIRFCASCQRAEEDKDAVIGCAVRLFGGIGAPVSCPVSPLAAAVLKRDKTAALRLLRAPEETVSVKRFLGVPFFRRVSNYFGEKIFIFGLQIYKRDPFYLGGRRRILGVPVSRAGFN